MARESKQERIVKDMVQNVSEQLHDLKALEVNPAVKELDVERWAQTVLKSCLGFVASNGYSIRAQEAKGKLRPDLLIVKDEKVICVVEIKKLGYNLNKSDLRSGKTQLGEYLHSLNGVNWGILCNGYEWRLYDFSNLSLGPVEVLSFDIRNDVGELDFSKRGIEDTCWELFDLHEVNFHAGSWTDLSKEATAFSPESLAKAILSADVVRHIARHIRGEHEYKASVESLIDKVALLLEKGLDDSFTDWSEVRQAELGKYIKVQKKAGRRSKRGSSKVVPDEAESIPENEGNDSSGESSGTGNKNAA